MIRNRMLSKEEEIPDSVTVTRIDQDRINKFSTLHQKRGLLEAELERKNEEKTDLSELLDELELADDEELFPLKIGDSFYHLPAEEVREHLEASSERMGKEIEAFEEKVEGIKKEMSELKVVLYAKFGKAINLEA
ncbi:Gim complex component GIM3-like protein [Ascobolus immersus RN42]|uniref:Prefoldin subunit 4 n=1 Tax=Ascobolus immersus RN42 TaxID=1160509 RepID=A0A3N4IMD2_ASCIM|nr:Gim complex component GIM3-like protein [Ascobolus immersus RN42]